MNFKITAIGTGAAFTKTQCHTSLLVEVENKRYLFDCGFKVPQALHDMGIDIKTIDGIVISHIHADHTGGLEEFGFMGMFVLNKKFDLYIAEDLIVDLWDRTLSGGMTDINTVNVDEVGTLNSYFNVKPFKNLESLNLNGMPVVPVKTVHVSKLKPSYSFILDNKAFFSADIQFDEKLILALHKNGIKTFFHDCQLFYAKNGVHASLDELSTLPQEIRKKVFALHYGDNYAQFEDKFKESGIRRVKQGDTFSFK